MIIVMKSGVTEADVEEVCRRGGGVGEPGDQVPAQRGSGQRYLHRRQAARGDGRPLLGGVAEPDDRGGGGHQGRRRRVAEAGKPVLLKRGMSTSIQEWLLSAEYILSGGNPRVILCERGIRTF